MCPIFANLTSDLRASPWQTRPEWREGKTAMTGELDRDILFCRMMGLLNKEELDGLAHKRVAVGGAGGVGFTHAEAFVRQGIGKINITDFDTFGPENMGRQFGCTVHTIGRNKEEVLAERLQAINPELQVQRFGAIGPENMDRFLDGVHFVADAVDYFNIGAHRLLMNTAHRNGIPGMIAGPAAYGCSVHFFHPDHMSFDEYFDLHDGQPEQQQLDHWGTGLGPMHMYRHYVPEPYLNMEKRTTSVVSSVCLLSTAVLSGVGLRVLLGQSVKFKPVPYVYHFDLVEARFEEVYIPDGVRGIKANPEKYFR
jgi:molybdopterin/thiamine biosynthesis adenylyltransferase